MSKLATEVCFCQAVTFQFGAVIDRKFDSAPPSPDDYVYGPWWARLNDRMTVSSEAVALCCPVKQQLIGATLEPGVCGGTPPDKRMPLIQFFEGQGFQEVFDSEVAEYIRTTQMEMKSDSEW